MFRAASMRFRVRTQKVKVKRLQMAIKALKLSRKSCLQKLQAFLHTDRLDFFEPQCELKPPFFNLALHEFSTTGHEIIRGLDL